MNANEINLSTTEQTMPIRFSDVEQSIRDGADASEVEAMISDERAELTDSQMATLRAELADRDAGIDASEMLTIDQVRDMVDAARVNSADFWNFAAGGDLVPMDRETVERIIAEVRS